MAMTTIPPTSKDPKTFSLADRLNGMNHDRSESFDNGIVAIFFKGENPAMTYHGPFSIKRAGSGNGFEFIGHLGMKICASSYWTSVEENEVPVKGKYIGTSRIRAVLEGHRHMLPFYVYVAIP